MATKLKSRRPFLKNLENLVVACLEVEAEIRIVGVAALLLGGVAALLLGGVATLIVDAIEVAKITIEETEVVLKATVAAPTMTLPEVIIFIFCVVMRCDAL